MRLHAALALVLTATTLASAADTASLGRGFIPAAGGQSCTSACEAAGKRAAKFTEFNASPAAETAVCAIKSAKDKEGWTPGWQAQNASLTTAPCSAALDLVTTNATDYACLCLEPGEVQGIDLPATNGKPCSKACAKSITGRPGRPVTPGTGGKSGYACLSLPTELGSLNRFGHTHNDGMCRTNIEEQAVESASFTCFCVFDAAADPGALAANARAAREKQRLSPAPAPALAPKKLLLRK